MFPDTSLDASQRVSAGLELGTYAAEVPVHISHMELDCSAYCMIMFCEQSLLVISPIRSKCHPVVLALMFSISERRTYFQATFVIRLACRVG